MNMGKDMHTTSMVEAKRASAERGTALGLGAGWPRPGSAVLGYL